MFFFCNFAKPILKNMKNTKLILALAMALCLVSCDFTATPKEEAAEPPCEWDFDLMWQVFMAMPYQGYDMEDAETLQSVKEKTKQVYDGQHKKNVLSVKTMDPVYCAYYVDMACFKCQGEDKLYVFYTSDEDCGSCNYDSRSFFYDLTDGTLTEIAHPIQPLEANDFFKEDIPAEQLAEMEPFEGCENENFAYELNYDRADLLVTCMYIDMIDRSIRLAFDWNGHEFVRKPEADAKNEKNG